MRDQLDHKDKFLIYSIDWLHILDNFHRVLTFSFIVIFSCEFIDIYVHTYTHTIYWVHLALWLLWALQETDSPSLSSHWLFVAPHLKVKPCEISPTTSGMLMGISLYRSCLSCHIVEISWVEHSAMCRRYYLKASVLVIWLLQSLFPLCHDILWVLCVEVVL